MDRLAAGSASCVYEVAVIDSGRRGAAIMTFREEQGAMDVTPALEIGCALCWCC